jgi:2-aminomuconate deaminase
MSRPPEDGEDEEESSEEDESHIWDKPIEVIDDLYDEYGQAIISHAGGAVGAAAGAVVGGPVGGIAGSIVGKKTVGKMLNRDGAINSENAPAAVGAYPHARRVGGRIYVSGIGPRQVGTNEIPGGPIHDENGQPLDYDIRAQTHAVIKNIEAILAEVECGLGNIIDCLVFLVDMERDFEGYNEVYAEYFSDVMASRTTVAVSALPTPIAVEFKVIAKAS